MGLDAGDVREPVERLPRSASETPNERESRRVRVCIGAKAQLRYRSLDGSPQIFAGGSGRRATCTRYRNGGDDCGCCWRSWTDDRDRAEPDRRSRSRQLWCEEDARCHADTQLAGASAHQRADGRLGGEAADDRATGKATRRRRHRQDALAVNPSSRRRAGINRRSRNDGCYKTEGSPNRSQIRG